MKKLIVVVASCLLQLSAAPASAHTEHGKPQFGGVIAEAGAAQFEIVAQDGRIVVHASNHGKPVDTAGATGKLTLLDGAAKSEVSLAPAGPNRLEGAGSLPRGAKLLIHVEWPGRKPLQGRAVAP